MISKATIQVCGLLLVWTGTSAGAAWALDVSAQDHPGAQDPWAQVKPAPEVTAVDPDGDNPVAKPDFPEPDWSLLDTGTTLSDRLEAQKRAAAKSKPDTETLWSAQDKVNASALSVKQSISPFWDARIGADMTVVNQPSTQTTSDLLRQKFSTDGQPTQSSGTAWAALTAPGVGSIWDKTAIEARLDPSQDQSKLGTTLSKSLPLWSDQYSLTLQNGYNVIQQSFAPVVGLSGHPVRNYQTDQSAKLSIGDIGTSFVAGQSLSSTDDKWLRKIGAEQKLLGGVSINGSISETPQGVMNRSFGAGFKHSW
jgi:hypothetical protein